MSNERRISHEFNSEKLESILVTTTSPKATIIQFPTVMGVSDLEVGFARTLAGKGFNSVVADLFGKEFHGASRDVMFGQMNRLREDRTALRDRLHSILKIVEQQEEVDPSRVAAIGFCFGGQCALDLARSGVEIAGVASFHGLFDPPGLEPRPIKARVIAFHGWDDPMVPPEKVVALGKELTDAGCDWQIHAFGHVGHGFTNPHASTLQIPGVQYNKLANDRSWYALDGFLGELFG